MADMTSKIEPQSIGSHPETSQLRNRRPAHVRPDALMQFEGSGQIPCYTSKMNFPPVPGSLLEYGLALMELDSICLNLIATNKAVLFGAKFQSLRFFSDFSGTISQSQGILAQFHEINMGRQQLNSLYLEDTHVIRLWKMAAVTFDPALADIPKNELGELVDRLGHGATKVANALIDAAKKDPLSHEREATLQERWTILEPQFFEAKHVLRTRSPIFVPTWSSLMEQVKDVVADKRRSGFLPHHAAVRSPEASPKPTILLWSTFTIIVGVGMAMVAQGFRYSPHQHGTPAEAAFWFLIQSSTMNVLAIFTMALPLWNRQTSGWIWLPVGLAVVCAIIAPIFYIFFATEWSALLSMFAGAIQAFITVQIALIAHEGGVSEHAKKD